jgi:exonuclease VII large subunit
MKRLILSLPVLLILLAPIVAPTPSRASGAAHPLIKRAVTALQAARNDLQNAAHDYCGHRVEALEATNAVLMQLQQALACDRKHHAAAEASIEREATTGSERYPNIRRAINALGAAERDLQSAAHDYCGHRVEALGAVQAALAQLKLAIECDRS